MSYHQDGSLQQEPAMPGVQLNLPSTMTAQPVAAQPERLGTLHQPASNERMTIPGMAPLSPNTMNSAFGDAVFDAAAQGMSPAQQAALQQMQSLQQMQAMQMQQQQLTAAMASGQQLTQQQMQTVQMIMMLQRNQLMQQQQQLMQQQRPPAPVAAPSQMLQQQFAASYGGGSSGRGMGGEPPAKRQAVDGNQQAQALASHHFRQLHATGGLSHMGHAQQTQLFQTLLARARAQLGLPPVHIGSNSMRNMRVSVDKRNKAAGDRLFQAEDTTGRDYADEVVRRCEEISKALLSHLGKGGKAAVAEGRFGGTDPESSRVSQAQLIEACGDTARYLKPYQIVGVNFLMLLYRTEVGGAILADEMGLGKTAQLISYLGAIKLLDKDPGPHLVVVPASLLENWQRELRRWCPGLKSVVYYGKHRSVVRRRLKELRARLERGEQVDDDLADLQDADVLAEAAASDRANEAERLATEDPHDDDPLGLDHMHESDDEFDVKRAHEDGNGLPPGPATEVPPPKWDYGAQLAPAPFHVMLTSYTLFERDSPDQRSDRDFLESWRWSHLIMDEAHALKNRSAQRTTRLRRVANVSRRRIMMTGTPLQNDLLELQNLMHFLLPTVFAAQGFEDFVKMLQGDDGEVRELTDRMKSLLGPFVLRRLKTEVAGQLTEKRHVTEFIPMTPEQDALYQASVQSLRNQINGKTASTLEEEGEAGMEKFVKTLGAKKINHMFTHLRKIAQHPLLIRNHYDDAKVGAIAKKAFAAQLFSGNATIRRVTDELLAYSDYSLHAFCFNSGPSFIEDRLDTTHLMTSTKFRFLADLLPKLKMEGSRPLIFSQWTAVLDVIEWLMDELRLPYVRLDGSTAVDERLATVDRFNTSDDVFAFLLSTRAGGQGLNLTGADTVILHDVDFNPQIDRQAEDRCHRLGQTKPVSVYRLVTKGTVDHNIYSLSQNKLKLDHAVLDGITTGRGVRQKEAAVERQQMGAILQSLFAGKDEFEEEPPVEEAEEALKEAERTARQRADHVKSEPAAAAAAAPQFKEEEPQQQQEQQQQQQQQPESNGYRAAVVPEMKPEVLTLEPKNEPEFSMAQVEEQVVQPPPAMAAAVGAVSQSVAQPGMDVSMAAASEMMSAEDEEVDGGAQRPIFNQKAPAALAAVPEQPQGEEVAADGAAAAADGSGQQSAQAGEVKTVWKLH